jgi:CubicO group peptidase (beta-lactamase class C family)
MAKFGQLFLNKGYWNGKEIIPENWIQNITDDYVLSRTPSRERFAHGYLWWIPSEDYAGGIPNGSYMSTGTSGQRILVIPKWNTVIAHKVMTEIPSRQRTPVSSGEFEKLVQLIMNSRN